MNDEFSDIISQRINSIVNLLDFVEHSDRNSIIEILKKYEQLNVYNITNFNHKPTLTSVELGNTIGGIKRALNKFFNNDIKTELDSLVIPNWIINACYYVNSKREYDKKGINKNQESILNKQFRESLINEALNILITENPHLKIKTICNQ